MSEVISTRRQLDRFLEHTRKKNGPAEAATSPSHGSHNPTKDQNMDDAITGLDATASPFRGYHDAFQRLETPIDRVLGFAKTQEMLGVLYSETIDASSRDELACVMNFIAAETRHAAFALESQWMASHNAGCDAQHAEAGR